GPKPPWPPALGCSPCVVRAVPRRSRSSRIRPPGRDRRRGRARAPCPRRTPGRHGGGDGRADGGAVRGIAGALTAQGPGLRVNLRGEHVVVALQDEETLAGLSMTGPAQVDPPLEGAAMLEFVLPLGEREGAETDAAGAPVRTGVIRMRARSGPAERRSSG